MNLLLSAVAVDIAIAVMISNVHCILRPFKKPPSVKNGKV
jgi:hypothetical protein